MRRTWLPGHHVGPHVSQWQLEPFLVEPSTQLVKVKLLSRVRLFSTPWTVANQAPPSMGFSRQEYWNGSPFPSPGDLPDPGIKPRSPSLQADALTSEPLGNYYLLCEVWLLLFPFKRQRNWGSGRWSCLFKATQWVSSGAETWGQLWLGSCLFAMCHEASL